MSSYSLTEKGSETRINFRLTCFCKIFLVNILCRKSQAIVFAGKYFKLFFLKTLRF